LKSIGKYVKINGIRDISTFSLLNLPLLILASIKFGDIFLTESFVSLQIFGRPKLRMSISGKSNYKVNRCIGISDESNELKKIKLDI
jgi:uncharacterized membrane-anchored protein YitT (DUF2179 family)